MKKEKRSIQIPFRVSASDAEKIRGWAYQSGMDVPDYLRRVVMRGVTFRIEEIDPEQLMSSVRVGRVEDLDERNYKERKHGTSG